MINKALLLRQADYPSQKVDRLTTMQGAMYTEAREILSANPRLAKYWRIPDAGRIATTENAHQFLVAFESSPMHTRARALYPKLTGGTVMQRTRQAK